MSVILPAVTVVVANFNNGPYLREALDSVLAQTFADYQIVVADDGSTDDSCAVVESWAAEHPERSLRLLRLPHTGEPALTRNAGIAAARTELVANLDGDDLLHPEFLERCVATLRANPLAGVAYSDQHHFGAVENHITCAEFDFDRLIHGGFFSNCSVFRKEAFGVVGGYVTDLGYEDWDLWIGFAVAGYPGVRAPGALFSYRIRETGRHVGDKSRDKLTKAKIVLRRPQLYSANQCVWARGVLAGDPNCLSLGEPRGAVPRFASDGPSEAQAAALIDAYRPGAEPVAPATVAAIVLAHDHAATIARVLDELAAGGATATVLDLGSCDDTCAIAQAHPACVRVERAADLTAALRRAEEICAEPGADWHVLARGDELRKSPWPDLTLAEALAFIGATGDTAVAFGGTIAAWKRTGVRVRLADTGGEPFFSGRSVSPAPASRDALVAQRGAVLFATRALGLDAPLQPNAFGRPPHTGATAFALALIEARVERAHARVAGRPDNGALAALESVLARKDDGLRSFVTLTTIGDLLGDPVLFAGYASRFGADDDATLVVHAPSADPEALNRDLLSLLEATGVDPETAPDILALTADRLDSTGWQATLTATGELDELRRRAERAWAA